MEKTEKVCIVCPIGCSLTIEKDHSAPEGYSVKGNRCIRGEKYAISEMVNPTRVVTSTVKIKDRPNLMLPVKTNIPIPKAKMFDIVNEIKTVEVKLPIKRKSIIIKNIGGTEANLIASKSMN